MIFNPFALAAVGTFLSSSTPTNADLSSFTGWATSILTWIISGFSSVLAFMLANPICFVWLIVSLVGVVFVFLRRTIGG